MSTPSPSETAIPSRGTLLRQVIPSDRLEGVVDLPLGLKNRLVEVILLPIENQSLPDEKPEGSVFSLHRFSGAWHGVSLVREDQEEYEQRENLE